MMRRLLQNLMISLLFSFGSVSAETPLAKLTHYNENLQDFPNWEIAKRTRLTELAYSPDGKVMASGSADNIIRLRDAQTGEIINTLRGHTDAISAIAYSPDGKVIASGSDDHTIRLWNAQSGENINILNGHTSWVSTIAYSPDGAVIASGSGTSNIRLWDSRSGEKINNLKGHTGSITAISYSPDGKTMASGSEDNTIQVWNVQSGKIVKTLKGHTRAVWTIDYSSDGKTIASGSSDNTIRLWNLQSGKTTKKLSGHTDFVRALAYSPDGMVIASGSSDNTIRLWNAESGEVIKTLEGHTDMVSSLAFRPDGKLVASGSYDGSLRIWNTQSGETIQKLKSQSSIVNSITYSPNGKVIASGSDEKIRLWHAQSGKNIQNLQGHTDSVNAITFNPDGKIIASGSSDNTIKLWNSESGENIKTLKGHTDNVTAIDYSPNGKIIASGSTDNTIRLWDAQSGENINILKGHSDIVTTIAYSPDGKVIASGSFDDTIRLWDSMSGEAINTFKGYVSAIAYSPDGKAIATASIANHIFILNSQSGEKINKLKGHSNSVFAVAYSPDGKFIVSGSGDNTMRLWNAQSGKNIKTLKGHTDTISSISYSPDGNIVASGSYDNTIRLWNNTTAPAAKTLIGGINGNWLSYDNEGSFHRGDDGSLLLTKKNGKLVSAIPKSIQAVPEQSLSVVYQGNVVELLGGGSTSFKLKVLNTSQQPLLWLRPQLVKPSGFMLYKTPTIQRLEAGKSTEITVKVGAHLPHTLTKKSVGDTEWVDPPTDPLQIEVIAPEQTSSNTVSVPVNVIVPKLELVSTEQLDNTLKVTVKNTGQRPVGDTRLKLSVIGAEVLELEEQSASGKIEAAGGIIEKSFVLPEGYEFNKDNKINLQVRTSGLPFVIWNFDNQQVQMNNAAWPMYLGLLVLSLLITAFVFYKKRYQHPMVLELSETPSALLNMPFESLDEAKRRLTQTSRLDNVLSSAGVSGRTLAFASQLKDLKASEKAQLIAKRLGAEAQPIQETLANAPDLALYQLTLAEGFPLNIDRLLLCFPETTASEDVFLVLKHHPDAQARITLIMGTDSDFQRKLLIKTSDTSNKWVAPQGVEVTRLLLAPDAETTLAEILAGQLSLQQISPYRIGGGVNNESVFFGRRELISQIINRDPANYLMAGGRQVGKSTLLKAVERRYEDNPQVECIYLTLSSEVLVPRLASLLKLERTDSAEVLATQLDGRIRESGQRFVFLIDEADRFISQEKAHDYSILNVFRRLSEEGNCTFILAGFWQLYQHAVLDYQSPIRNFGELLSVGELEKPACIELVTQPMKTMNLSYANDTLVGHIVDSCGQRANLIAIACQHIVRNLPPKQRIIEAGDVDKALRSDELRRALSGWVVGETEDEQTYERMVVYATIGMPSFTTGELLELAKRHGVAIDTLVLDRTLSRLELAFVLGRKDSRWFYRVPLFVDYIAEDSPELKLQAELRRIGQYG